MTNYLSHLIFQLAIFELLIFNSSILKPDLHLPVSQVQIFCDGFAFLSRNEVVRTVFVFEIVDLTFTIGLAFFSLVVSGRMVVRKSNYIKQIKGLKNKN